MATDYHSKPLIPARVPRESLDWARGEAKRRGQPFGDFMDGLIAAERERVADHVVDPAPVAAKNSRPPEDCPHPKARINKGLCGACGTYVGTKGS